MRTKFFTGRNILLLVAVLVILIGGFYAFNTFTQVKEQGTSGFQKGYKDTTYTIEGQAVTLVDGIAQTPAAPGSASMVTTKYFGNELVADLNGDGKDDVAFILTQNSGGSGTFYYAVAAISTANEYVGSDGYLLGDRVAPQATTLSQNPNQKNVVVFNYADRNASEPMTTPPSVGKSVYLKIDPSTMQWGVVEPNFEGESR